LLTQKNAIANSQQGCTAFLTQLATAAAQLADRTASSTYPDADDTIAITDIAARAEGPNAEMDQVLALTVQPTATAAAGVYDVDVKCGEVQAFTDALGKVDGGLGGSYRMNGALKIVQIPFLAVDGNRDGSLTFDPEDVVSTEQPWRWWINDNNDKPGKD